MKKLIYATFVDYEEKSFLGVIQKIDFQMRALESHGLECTLIGQYGSGAVVAAPGKERRIITNGTGVSKRRFLTDVVAKEIESGEYIGAYIRFQFFCNNMLAMLKNMKKHGMKVMMEIPTYPYEGELRLQGLRGIPKLLCDRMFRRSCYRHIDLLALSGSEKELCGVPAFCMKNGLYMENFKVSDFEYNKNRMDMISVSSMLPWHGLDRVMRGMAAYYKNGGEREVVLHAVGDGRMKKIYEDMAKELGIEDKVIFYGALFGEELNKVYDKCSIGICLLGAHLKNFREGSPLKTVEYVTRGLGVITSVNLRFMDSDSPFCMRVPWDDSDVDIAAAFAFNDSLFSENCEATKKSIRKAAEKTCDMKQHIVPAVEFFTKV